MRVGEGQRGSVAKLPAVRLQCARYAPLRRDHGGNRQRAAEQQVAVGVQPRAQHCRALAGAALVHEAAGPRRWARRWVERQAPGAHLDVRDGGHMRFYGLECSWVLATPAHWLQP